MSANRVWSKWLRRAALALGLLAIVYIGRGAKAEDVQPNKLTIVELLRYGQYEPLEAMLVGYQQRFEADHKAQWPTVVAFEAFANSDSALEPRLDEWIAKMPDSYAAPLARGVFYNHLGWISRGCECAAGTPGPRFDEMGRFFARAKPDLQHALALNPRLVVAYDRLADMAMAEGDRSEVERVLNAGLALAPDAITLHENFLFSLQPKWVGAPGDVRRYLAALKESSPDIAGLARFQGYDDFDQGERLLDEGKFEDALARFDRALGFAPHSPGFLSARADALLGLSRYDEGVVAIELALAGAPQSAGYYLQMGKLRSYQGRGAEALASLNRAIALDRLNPHYLYWRALVLQSLGRYDEAVHDLDAAVIYGAYDATIQAERSRALTRFQDRLDDAVSSARSVTELEPKASLGWLRYAEALYFKRDCKAKDTLETFHELCKRDGRCEVEQQDSAPALIRFMRCGAT